MNYLDACIIFLIYDLFATLRAVGTAKSSNLFSRNNRSRSKRGNRTSLQSPGEHNNPRTLNIFGSDLMSEDFILSRLDELEANEDIVLVELEDCLVSSYSVSAGEAAPAEGLSLSFAKITMSYTAADRANAGATPERVGYDLETGKKL